MHHHAGGNVCKDGVCGIIEIKCPFGAKGLNKQEAVSIFHKIKTFCLHNVNGVISLKRDHDYFYQVQGRLMISGASFCDFVVYTPADVHIETKYPDVYILSNMLEKLAFIFKYKQIPTA